MYKWYIQCIQHDITILNRYQRWNRELIANNETIYHTSTNNVKHKTVLEGWFVYHTV